MKNTVRASAILLAAFVLSVSLYSSTAQASDDVAPLVVDNGNGSTTAPEPSTLSLLLGGVVAAGLYARLKKK